MLLLICCHLGKQLVDVFDPGLSLVGTLSFQFFHIAGVFQHFIHQLPQGQGTLAYPEGVDHIGKRPDLHAAFSKGGDLLCNFQRFIKAHAVPLGKICHPVQGRGTDAPLGHVDDPAHRQIVLTVVDGFQISQNVLDLFPGIEVHTTDDLIRHVHVHKPFLKQTGLGIGTVKDRAVMIGIFSFPHPAADVTAYVIRLLIGIVKIAQGDLVSRRIFRPEPLVFPPFVVVDHIVGRIQDVLGGTVILFQLDDGSIRKNLLEIQDIADVGPPEFVNGLVIVTHHAQIPVFACQKAYQLELRRVGVLILVHHDITKTLLVRFQHIRCPPEQLHRFHDEIVKIQRIAPF